MRVGVFGLLCAISALGTMAKQDHVEASICDASWGPIYRRIDHTMDYIKSSFNASFDFVLDELDELIDESTSSLQVKLQDHVVALAEDQRRIARMHRQLSAALDNGAKPDQTKLYEAGLRKTTADLSVKTTVNEIVHGESWLILVGQVAFAVALGSGYERFRSGRKILPSVKSS